MTDQPGIVPRVFAEAEFRHLLEREVQRSTRYQDFLGLCLIRARYPGAPLPAVETAVAREVMEMLRSTDIVGICGQDVGVLLVHTPPTDAAMITERVRDRIQGTTFRETEPLGRVTVGIGLACFPTDATDSDGLLAHAQGELPTGLRASGGSPEGT